LTLAKNKGKKHEPWYLMYLLLIPVFLIAIVPEGFFTWQVIMIFAVVMALAIVLSWVYIRKEPKTSGADAYLESLRQNNKNKKS
jgi:uncharacterized membrane protein (DUF485 family)